jgi:serine/threonine protein phosphatase PrpC
MPDSCRVPLRQREVSSSFLAQLSDDIVKESLRRGSRDNITVMLVKLEPPMAKRSLDFSSA